jgi:CheY-like chemotaxis protein
MSSRQLLNRASLLKRSKRWFEMRILYVEDNPANLFLVQRVARMGNHEVTNYTEGQPALDHFKDDKPDLVLMDIQLSGTLNGLDVVKALRAAGHKTPIVAVTAYAMSGDREKCIEAGCDGYLSKPLPVGELVELFKRYEPAKAAGVPAPVTAPAAATPTIPAPEPKLEIVADAKPAPAAQSTPVEPAKVEAAPVTPSAAAPAPAAETKPEVSANPYATPVLLKLDSATVKDAPPAPIEEPAAPAVEAKVESPTPAPETAKPAASANPLEPAASQGTSKESGEKIGAESKPS